MNRSRWQSSVPLALVLYPTLLGLIIRLTLTQIPCPVTLTLIDPLTLKLVHGVLVSQGPFLPNLVFLGLFVFPLGGGTGQADGQDRYMMGVDYI